MKSENKTRSKLNWLITLRTREEGEIGSLGEGRAVKSCFPLIIYFSKKLHFLSSNMNRKTK